MTQALRLPSPAKQVLDRSQFLQGFFAVQQWGPPRFQHGSSEREREARIAQERRVLRDEPMFHLLYLVEHLAKTLDQYQNLSVHPAVDCAPLVARVAELLLQFSVAVEQYNNAFADSWYRAVTIVQTIESVDRILFPPFRSAASDGATNSDEEEEGSMDSANSPSASSQQPLSQQQQQPPHHHHQYPKEQGVESPLSPMRHGDHSATFSVFFSPPGMDGNSMSVHAAPAASAEDYQAVRGLVVGPSSARPWNPLLGSVGEGSVQSILRRGGATTSTEAPSPSTAAVEVSHSAAPRYPALGDHHHPPLAPQQHQQHSRQHSPLHATSGGAADTVEWSNETVDEACWCLMTLLDLLRGHQQRELVAEGSGGLLGTSIQLPPLTLMTRAVLAIFVVYALVCIAYVVSLKVHHYGVAAENAAWIFFGWPVICILLAKLSCFIQRRYVLSKKDAEKFPWNEDMEKHMLLERTFVLMGGIISISIPLSVMQSPDVIPVQSDGLLMCAMGMLWWLGSNRSSIVVLVCCLAFNGITLATMLVGTPAQLEDRLEFGLTLGFGIFIWRLVTFEPPKPTHFRMGCHRHICASLSSATFRGAATSSSAAQQHPAHAAVVAASAPSAAVSAAAHRGEFVNGGAAVDTRSLLSSGGEQAFLIATPSPMLHAKTASIVGPRSSRSVKVEFDSGQTIGTHEPHYNLVALLSRSCRDAGFQLELTDANGEPLGGLPGVGESAGDVDSERGGGLPSLIVVGNRSKAKSVIDQLVAVIVAVIVSRNGGGSAPPNNNNNNNKRSSHNSIRKAAGGLAEMLSFQLDPPCLRCNEMQHMVPSAVSNLRQKLESESECGLSLDYGAQRGFALRYKPSPILRPLQLRGIPCAAADGDETVLMITEEIAMQSALTRLLWDHGVAVRVVAPDAFISEIHSQSELNYAAAIFSLDWLLQNDGVVRKINLRELLPHAYVVALDPLTSSRRQVQSQGVASRLPEAVDVVLCGLPSPSTAVHYKRLVTEVRLRSFTKSPHQLPKSFQDTVAVRKIGQGSSASVFRVRDHHWCVCAMKVISERTLHRNHVDVAETLQQETAKIALRHDNIVQVHHASSHQGNGGEILVFSELCSDITLRAWLRLGALKVHQASHVTRDVLQGLLYLHEQGRHAGDLKSENILFGSGRKVKIADYSSSFTTMNWRAPEFSHHPPRTAAEREQADVWALGCLQLEMMHGRDYMPFGKAAPPLRVTAPPPPPAPLPPPPAAAVLPSPPPARSMSAGSSCVSEDTESVNCLVSLQGPVAEAHTRPAVLARDAVALDIPDTAPDMWVNFTVKCLCPIVAERPSLKQLLEFDFLALAEPVPGYLEASGQSESAKSGHRWVSQTSASSVNWPGLLDDDGHGFTTDEE